MAILLIAYDLSNSSSAGSALSGAIMGLGKRWARPLAALWYVETEASAADVEAALAPLLDAEDGLLVQQAVGEAVVANTMLRWTAGRRAASAPAELESVVAWPGAGNVTRLPCSTGKVAVAA